ncbi:MAG: hypothetical protein IJ468_12715 [Lachnospiraceae bacterium]|nr:hypothetical protein [Lachnospiraceae bacterium]
MEENKKPHKNFVAYEYKEVIASNSNASMMLDVYECFGWEVDGNMPGGMETSGIPHVPKVYIRLKRDRRIVNKMELTRLQRNFEACMKEIETLERNKNSMATMYALIVGLIGTVFMAGSVFAVTAQPPHIGLCILLAIPAFLGWLFPPFLYAKLVEKERLRITPLIEAKYDEIYELCEKGSKLLY